MTFIVYGPGVRDPFPVDKLFRRHVEETRKTNATHAVKEMGEDTVPERILTKQAGNAYHTVEQLPQDEPVMYAFTRVYLISRINGWRCHTIIS